MLILDLSYQVRFLPLQQIFLLQFHTYFSMNQIQQQTVDYTANDG